VFVLARARPSHERPVPAYVEDELRGYLECGLLCFGFARAVCSAKAIGLAAHESQVGPGVLGEMPWAGLPPILPTALRTSASVSRLKNPGASRLKVDRKRLS
jgi:hypothetical protein